MMYDRYGIKTSPHYTVIDDDVTHEVYVTNHNDKFRVEHVIYSDSGSYAFRHPYQSTRDLVTAEGDAFDHAILLGYEP